MPRLSKPLFCALLLATSLHTASAEDLVCADSGIRVNWIDKFDFTDSLIARGWEVSSINEEKGCWQVKGTSPEGKTAVGYFHPGTGEKVLVTSDGEVIYRAGE